MLINIAADSSQSRLSQFQPGDIQPNAVDLRLDKIFEILDTGFFEITDDSKIHHHKRELTPNGKGFFRLEPRRSYEVTFEGTITLGPDEAGFVITRSTLNRNGLFFTSGLYDSGYSGSMAGALHNLAGNAFIQKGTRVAQFLLWKAQSLHQYNGSYGFNADGTVKAEEARYHA